MISKVRFPDKQRQDADVSNRIEHTYTLSCFIFLCPSHLELNVLNSLLDSHFAVAIRGTCTDF